MSVLFDPQLSNFSYQNSIIFNQILTLYVALPPKTPARDVTYDFKENKVDSTITVSLKGRDKPIFQEKLTCGFEKPEEWQKTGDAFTVELRLTGIHENFQAFLERGTGFYLIDREVSKNEISDEAFWNDEKFNQIKEHVLKETPRDDSNVADYADYEKLMSAFAATVEERDKNMSEGLAKLISAANKGNLDARQLLAGVYSSEEQCKTWKITMDLEKASLYRKLAAFDNEDILALFLFGNSSLNENEALIALERAARKGFAPAIHRLGKLYESMGDFKKSIEFYQVGFARGHSMCALALHSAHLTGNGVNKSMEFAKEYKQFAKNWDPMINTFEEPIEPNHDDILESTLEELTHQTAILDPTNFTPISTKSVHSVFDDFAPEKPVVIQEEVSTPVTTTTPIVTQQVKSQPVQVAPVVNNSPIRSNPSSMVTTTTRPVSKPSTSKPMLRRGKKQQVIEEELDDDDIDDDMEEDGEEDEEDDQEEEEEKPSKTPGSDKGFLWDTLEKSITYVAPSLFAVFVYKRFTEI